MIIRIEGEFMIWFFRDFLDGPVYIIVAVLSLIFIMAIIGFIAERLQLEKEEKNRVAVLGNDVSTVPPVSQVAGESPASQVPSNSETTVIPQQVSSNSVVPESVVQKSENAITNDAIPAVLDLNAVESSDQVK